MIVKDKNGRELEIEFWGFDADCITVESGIYLDTDEEADDDTLDWITEAYSDELYVAWMERAVSSACDWG